MSPDLDLTRRQWTKTRMGVTAIGTWIRLENQFRPCMVLIPADRDYDERTIPCVIPLDRAWVWDETIGDPSQSAPTAYQFALNLGLSVNDPRTVIRLAMFICDMLGDLLKMPPYQADRREVVAYATLTERETGKVVGESDVIEG